MTAGFCHSRMDIRLKDAPFNQKRLFLILLRYHPVPLQLPQRFAALLTAKEGKPVCFDLRGPGGPCSRGADIKRDSGGSRLKWKTANWKRRVEPFIFQIHPFRALHASLSVQPPGGFSRPSLPNHHPEHGRELISYFPQGHKQHGKRKKLFSFNRHPLPSGSRGPCATPPHYP